MYIIALAWIYVVLMMSVAEASSAQGSLLGACITFVLYGVVPLSIVLYIFGTPARKRALAAAREAAASSTPAASALQPDASRHAPADAAVAPVREEP